MANDFSGDSNCVSLYNMESGALTTDSKGTTTLTDNNTVTEDTTNYKQGSCSAHFATGESLSCANGDLASDFPFKSGGATKSSWCMWHKYDGTSAENIIALGDSTHGFRFREVNGDSFITQFYDGSGLIGSMSVAGCVAGRWYHIAWTYDSADDSYRMRCWGETENDFIDTDATGTLARAAIPSTGTNILLIGNILSNTDELVIFKDVLTTAEIDQIRTGTYGAGGPSGDISGTGSASFSATGVLQGRGSLVGSSAIAFSASSTLEGKGSLSGSAGFVFNQSGVLEAKLANQLSGTGSFTFGQSGVLEGRGALQGQGDIQFGQSAVLEGKGDLVGSAGFLFGQTGTLTGRGSLQGQGDILFSQVGVLTGRGDLSGTGLFQFSAVGVLDLPAGQMIGLASFTFSSAGVVEGWGDLVGANGFQFGATGTLIDATAPAVQGSNINLGGDGGIFTNASITL